MKQPSGIVLRLGSAIALVTALGVSCDGGLDLGLDLDLGKGKSREVLGFTLSGVVLDNLSGDPVVGAEVLLTFTEGSTVSGAPARGVARRATSREAKTLSGPSGEYLIKDILLPDKGDLQLVARASGYAPAYQILALEDMAEDPSLAVALRLQPVMYSLALGENGDASSPDGAIHLRLSGDIVKKARVRGAGKEGGSKKESKVKAQVSVGDPTVDQDLFPGGFEVKPEPREKQGTKSGGTTAKEPQAASGGQKAADPELDEKQTLEPVSFFQVSVTDEKGRSVSGAVSAASPASVTVKIPPGLQDKHLKKFDRGKRHVGLFCYDAADGKWVRAGNARLLTAERKRRAGEKTEKGDGKKKAHRRAGAAEGKVRELFAEVTLKDACWAALGDVEDRVCIEGRVVNASSQPVERMWIRAEGLRSHFEKDKKVRKRTGEYRIRVPAGEIAKLSANLVAHPKRKEKKFKKHRPTAGASIVVDTRPHVLAGRRGECLAAPDIVVAEPVKLRGRVQSKKGKALKAHVITSEGTATPVSGDGTFEVPAETASVDLTVQTEQAGVEVATVVEVKASDDEETVDVGTVEVAEPAVLVGTITEGPEKTPVEGAVVSVDGNQAVTDAEGEYTLAVPASGEVVEFIVASTDEEGERLVTEEKAKITEAAQIAVPPVALSIETACVVGQVVDADGNGIAGATVRTETSPVFVTDGEGRFGGEVPRMDTLVLTAGVRIGAIDEERTATVAVAPAAQGQCADVTLAIDDRPALITGELKGSSGQPLEGVEVVSSFGASDETDENGVYEIEAPPEAEVTLSCSLGEVHQEVTVTAGDVSADRDVDIPLPTTDAPPQVEVVEMTPEAATPGGTVTIALEISDEGGTVRYEVPELQAGAVAQPSGDVAVKEGEGTFSLTFTAPTSPDWYPVPVTLTDAEGHTGLTTISVDVRGTNAPPTVVEAVPSTQAPVAGELVTVEVPVDDADGDSLDFGWELTAEDGTDLSSLIKTDGGPTASFVCPKGQEGRALEVEVTVRDCEEGTSGASCRTTGAATEHEKTVTIEVVVGTGEGRPSLEEVIPDTLLVTGPGATSTSTQQAFEFASTVDAATFTCSLDGAAAAACPSKTSYSSLAAGSHTLTVQAVSPAGGADPTPLQIAWTLDPVVPETAIDSGPASATAQKEATFKFSSPDTTATFECELNSGGYRSCVSPLVLADLPEGANTFKVRAKDAVGNVDATPATKTWNVDLTPPTFLGLTSIKVVSSTQVDLSWSAATDNVTDASTILYDACRSTTAGGCCYCGGTFTPLYTSAAGATSLSATGLSPATTYYFTVRARDAAGLRDTNQVTLSVTTP
ncbi:MAG: hypothetical protein HYY13_08475 [Nitrospirae bacterium]|nr:hypothetical protein [Nitrospirota bacterium]